MTRLHVPVLAAVLAAAVVSVPALPASAADRGTPPIVLNGSGPTPVPLKNMAMIVNTEWGPRYVAGQQKSKLKVTVSGTDTVTFRDRGTRSWKQGKAYMPKNCRKQHAKRGVKATCTIRPKWFQDGVIFVQIWPRLGNDRIDGSTLPSWVRFWVLTDKGDDVVSGGAGDDFVNGGQGADTAFGGDGDDWIRTGLEGDVLDGGAGDDLLVGVDGDDVIRGGLGTDRVGGGPGNDTLYGDEGPDKVLCSGGTDTYEFDPADDTDNECEVPISAPAA